MNEPRKETAAASVTKSEKADISLAANAHTGGDVSNLLRRFSVDAAIAEGRRIRERLTTLDADENAGQDLANVDQASGF